MSGRLSCLSASQSAAWRVVVEASSPSRLAQIPCIGFIAVIVALQEKTISKGSGCEHDRLLREDCRSLASVGMTKDRVVTVRGSDLDGRSKTLDDPLRSV